MKGIFVTFEGADGSGKTTQITMLKEYLQGIGYEAVVTREPGGTVLSEAIRDLVLDKQYTEMSYRTEMLLYAASRAQHVEQLIRPALEAGKAVICDRFVDSSAVYQGVARGLGTEMVYQVNHYATGGLAPDITFLLDIDAQTGIDRKKNQTELDRLELEKMDFHIRVMDAYRSLAAENPQRMTRIDGKRAPMEIHKEIIEAIQQKLL